MKQIIFGILLILTLPLYADTKQVPESIDYYSEKGIEVEFSKAQDSSVIYLKFPDGETIYFDYEEEDFAKLQSKKIKRGLLKYTNKDGVQLYIPQLNKHFKVIGTMEKHPIDIALQECIDEFSTWGMVHCALAADDAWDAELNRAYKALGGNNNASLKKAQLAWIKYRDAQIEALLEVYDNKEIMLRPSYGHVPHILNLTKSQANLLKTMNSESLKILF